MGGLNYSQIDINARIGKKMAEAKAGGADGLDLLLAREAGFHGLDVMNLRNFTRKEGLLLVIRCPKRNAAAFIGDVPAKTMATKQKTNASGLVYDNHGNAMVSDYDMMSVWRQTGTGYQKIFVSAVWPPGALKGRWHVEAARIVHAMNLVLKNKLQHGCQDDWVTEEKNPGVKLEDHFLAFQEGNPTYLRTYIYCEAYYYRFGLTWPYTREGKYVAMFNGNRNYR